MIGFVYVSQALLFCFFFSFTDGPVPTFATAHTFCAPRDDPRKSGFLTLVLAKTGIFLRRV